MKKLVLSMVALSAMLCVGCENMPWNKDKEGGEMKSTSAAPAQKTLYERLGGKPAITLVVDDFVGRAASDPKVNFTRKGVPGAEWAATPENVAHLKMQLVDFISQVAGGPKAYKGKSMKESHKNMQITSAEFDAIAADLKASLDKLKVPAKEQGELMSAVAGTKGDIVTK